MKSKLNTFFKSTIVRDSIVYGLTNALYTGLPILLMPFLIAILNPEDYGVIELFRTSTMILTPVLGLSAVQSITRFYYDLDEKDFKLLTSSIINLQIINTIIALTLVYLLSFFIEKKYFIIINLAIIFFLFNQITEALLSIYRVKKQSLNYLIIRVGTVIIDLSILCILYYTLTNYDWTYRVYPNVIATVIFGFVSLYLFWTKLSIKFEFNKQLLKTALVYSMPLIIHMISGYILNIGDRFFITYYLGTKELGNYSVAYQIGLIVSFFYTSFSLAWTPIFFELMKSKNFEKIKKIKTVIFILVPLIGLLSVFGWIIISKFIPNLEKYNVELNLVIIIALAYVIYSLYRFNSLYFFYYKKTKILATITLVTGLICVVLYILLIPIYGIYGAAYATLITFILMFFSTYLFKPNEKLLEEN